MSNELILTDANFQEHIRRGLILIDFWAPWCGPCRIQGPIIAEVASALAGSALVAKCNIDEAKQTAAAFKIQSIPTLIILKQGKEAHRFMGVQQKNILLSTMLHHLSQSSTTFQAAQQQPATPALKNASSKQTNDPDDYLLQG